MIAVSGGPDSTALLTLAARWAGQQKKRRPKLLAITIDHGLRPQAAAEAAAVKRLARRLGVPHRTLRWRGKKPESGLQEAARIARYRLLAQAAARAGYGHVMTAHTLDDQAETVLFRLARGSGLTGLAGMATASPLPVGGSEIFLLRPLLHVAKSRLIATLEAAGISYAEDPSNSDPRFTRARLRALMPALAHEGLDARGLARLAMRMRRAEATIEFAVARRARERLRPVFGVRAVQWSSTARALRSCRRKLGCAFSAAPSLTRVTRDRSNLVNLRCCTAPCARRRAVCGRRLPAPWSRWPGICLESSAHPPGATPPCAESARGALRNRFMLFGGFPCGGRGFPCSGAVPRLHSLAVRDVKPPRFRG